MFHNEDKMNWTWYLKVVTDIMEEHLFGMEIRGLYWLEESPFSLENVI